MSSPSTLDARPDTRARPTWAASSRRDDECTVSHEVRWMFDGVAPGAARRWIAAGTKRRVDVYTSFTPESSTKLRGAARLEQKILTASAVWEATGLETVRGTVETWSKRPGGIVGEARTVVRKRWRKSLGLEVGVFDVDDGRSGWTVAIRAERPDAVALLATVPFRELLTEEHSCSYAAWLHGATAVAAVGAA